jgi:excisionase family DNA binding protein
MNIQVLSTIISRKLESRRRENHMIDQNAIELITKLIRKDDDSEPKSDSEYLTIGDIAKILKVSRPAVLSWINHKKHPLPSYRFGERQIRIKQNDFEEWVMNYRAGSTGRIKKLDNNDLGS